MEIPKNNTVWYVVGIVTIGVGIGIALWYFDFFNSSKPGTGSTPVASAISNVAGNTNIVSPVGDSLHQIQVTDNQTSSIATVVPEQEVNNAWTFRSQSNVDASSSSAPSNHPWGEGPPSPTGSTDSSETIRASNTARPYILLRRTFSPFSSWMNHRSS